MLVTTSNRHQAQLVPMAKEIARELGLPFIHRDRFSMEEIMHINQVEQLLVVTRESLKLFFLKQMDDPFFFHPRSAMFRIKRLMRGEKDPFVEAAQLKPGVTLLDCTLGFATDSIVASYVCKPSQVVGLESTQLIAFIVQRGLLTWTSDLSELREAMQRIHILHQTYQEYLVKCPDRSFDVLYFDPMFEQTNQLSMDLSPLKKMANFDPVTADTIREAKRVAKKRVVFKDSSYSSSFEELGFKPIVRKYASHWYGVMELE